MNKVISQPLTHHHFTPQTGRNRKSLQIKKISQRISLLKHQLQKQKREASLDQIHLKKINSLSESFSQKVLQEMGKCKELKSIGLKTDENANQDNLRSQNKNRTLESNKNLYNQDCLNSKTNLNSHINANQSLSSNKLPLNIDKRNKVNDGRTKSLNVHKRLNAKNMKNTGQNERICNFYLKETFLTSLIFILLGTVFRQIFPIV